MGPELTWATAQYSLQTEPSSLPAPGPEELLWYRDNDTSPCWEQLDNLPHARDVIRSRSARDPWATILRTVDIGLVEDVAEEANTLEVLGWADRVYVCGDVGRPGYQWRWSSWPDGPEHGEETPGWAGPKWYGGYVWEAQIVTVNDAIAQLIPALHAVPEVARQAPGYVWLPRERDLSPLTELRRPDAQ